MTISSTTAKNQYTANGVQTVFAYQFKVFAEADLDVYLDETLQASGFSVSGVGDDGGGSVTFSVAPTNGVVVTALRNQPQVQSTELPTQGPFPSEAVEAELDKQVMMILALDERVSRSLLLEVSSTLTDLSLPTPEIGKALGWNSDGDGLTNLELASGALLSTYMATVAASANAGAAQTALGGSTLGKTLFGIASETAARTALGTVANARTAAKTATYAFTAADCGKLVPVDATSAAFTQTLTAAATVGAGFVIGFQKIDASYNAVTLDGSGAETVNGVADQLLTDQWETIWLMCDGTNWQVIGYVPGLVLKDNVIIERKVIAAVATADFLKGWTTTQKFTRMVFELDGIFPSIADANMSLRVSLDGSTFQTGGTYVVLGMTGTTGAAPAGFGGTTNTEFTFTGATNNAAAQKGMAHVEIGSYADTDAPKRIRAWGIGRTAGGLGAMRDCWGAFEGSNSALLGVRFLPLPASGGNFTGTIVQKGVR